MKKKHLTKNDVKVCDQSDCYLRAPSHVAKLSNCITRVLRNKSKSITIIAEASSKVEIAAVNFARRAWGRHSPDFCAALIHTLTGETAIWLRSITTRSVRV